MSSKEFPHLLPRNFLIAIGSLSTHYAYLESVIEISIWAFLNLVREDGALVTTHLGMVSKHDILNGLVMKRFDKDSPKLLFYQEQLKKVEEVRIERNKIVHGFYAYKKRGPIPRLKTTARKGLKEEYSEVTLEQIDQVTFDAWSTVCNFMDAIDLEFPDYRAPWQARSPQPDEE